MLSWLLIPLPKASAEAYCAHASLPGRVRLTMQEDETMLRSDSGPSAGHGAEKPQKPMETEPGEMLCSPKLILIYEESRPHRITTHQSQELKSAGQRVSALQMYRN